MAEQAGVAAIQENVLTFIRNRNGATVQDLTKLPLTMPLGTARRTIQSLAFTGRITNSGMRRSRIMKFATKPGDTVLWITPKEAE